MDHWIVAVEPGEIEALEHGRAAFEVVLATQPGPEPGDLLASLQSFLRLAIGQQRLEDHQVPLDGIEDP